MPKVKVETRIEQVQSVEDYIATGEPRWWLRSIGEQEFVHILFIRGCDRPSFNVSIKPGAYVLGVGPSDERGVRVYFAFIEKAPNVYEQLSDLQFSLASELAYVISQEPSEDAIALAHEVVFVLRCRTGADLANLRREFAELAERCGRSLREPQIPTEPANEIPCAEVSGHSDTLRPVDVCGCGDMFCVGCEAKEASRPMHFCQCGDPRCDVGES